jgi:hypothetical protein
MGPKPAILQSETRPSHASGLSPQGCPGCQRTLKFVILESTFILQLAVKRRCSISSREYLFGGSSSRRFFSTGWVQSPGIMKRTLSTVM